MGFKPVQCCIRSYVPSISGAKLAVEALKSRLAPCGTRSTGSSRDSAGHSDVSLRGEGCDGSV